MSVEETNCFEKEREANRKPHSAVVAAKMNPPQVGTRAEQFDRSANLDDNSFAAPVESAGSKSASANHADKEKVFAEHRKANSPHKGKK
jgi:hypothetical protein